MSCCRLCCRLQECWRHCRQLADKTQRDWCSQNPRRRICPQHPPSALSLGCSALGRRNTRSLWHLVEKESTRIRRRPSPNTKRDLWENLNLKSSNGSVGKETYIPCQQTTCLYSPGDLSVPGRLPTLLLEDWCHALGWRYTCAWLGRVPLLRTWTEVWSGDRQFDVALLAGKRKKSCFRWTHSEILIEFIEIFLQRIISLYKFYINLDILQSQTLTIQLRFFS